MTLSTGTKIVITKPNGGIFLGTIKAVFEDYYIVNNRRGGINYVYEGEFVTYNAYYNI